jgi:hypothetical protein
VPNDHEIEVVVLDNGSTDNSATTARELGATVLELPGLRVGELRNRGAAVALGRVLAFVDADHEIGPLWIDAALETLREPNVAAVGAQYSPPDAVNWVQRVYNGLRRHPVGITDVGWLGSGNLAVWGSAFASVGGFDSTLEACEDVDLCQRLVAAGHRLMSDSRMRSIHHGDPASLRALFLGELWRGRDNVRVTLRGPFSFKNLRSLVVPVIDLLCIVAVAVAVAVPPWRSLAPVAATVFGGVTAARSLVVFRRLPETTALDLARTFVVTFVYDLGRALALVARFPHRRARGSNIATARG